MKLEIHALQKYIYADLMQFNTCLQTGHAPVKTRGIFFLTCFGY
jgi:hypothetical protein